MLRLPKRSEAKVMSTITGAWRPEKAQGPRTLPLPLTRLTAGRIQRSLREPVPVRPPLLQPLQEAVS